MPEPTPQPVSPPATPSDPPTRGFLRELFDLQFTTVLATRMMPGVYALGIALAGGETGCGVGSGMRLY